MSVADPERAPSAAPGAFGMQGAWRGVGGGRQQTLTGWGRAASSRARVVTLTSGEQVADVLADRARAGGGVIARGAGRSYGDGAQSAGGTVLSLTGLDRVLGFDGAQRLVRVQAGVTYARLLAELVPRGFGLPVIPGTRHVTIGGAIASDVHGKNHCHDGSLARHVSSLVLATPADGCRELTAQRDGELMRATLGGMGLTGIVLEATLSVEPLGAPWWIVDTDRTDSLDGTLALMARDTDHRFSVAWLDLLAPARSLGRAVVTRSNDGSEDSRADARRWHASGAAGGLGTQPRLRIPRASPGALLQPPLIGALNALRWRRAPRRERGRPTALAAHFFPLDAVGDWNRLYGSRGLLQYQFVVPYGAEATLARVIGLLGERRIPTYLAVLKRLGEGSGGPLSFPLAGWTLALDFPAWAPGLRPALDTVDELVAGVGGRVYLTKDLRLRADLLATMYPQLHAFRAQRARVDPDGVLGSDLGRRLGLCRTVS